MTAGLPGAGSGNSSKTPFQLFFRRDDENCVPVRIEYRAKSFPRVVLELDPELAEPAMATFLNKEKA